MDHSLSNRVDSSSHFNLAVIVVGNLGVFAELVVELIIVADFSGDFIGCSYFLKTDLSFTSLFSLFFKCSSP